MAAHCQAVVAPGETFVVQVRFSKEQHDKPFAEFDAIFSQRIEEADDFYNTVLRTDLSEDERNVARQAFAGLMWSKQFYHYGV